MARAPTWWSNPVAWILEAILVAALAGMLLFYLIALMFGRIGGDRSAALAQPITPALVARGAYLAHAGDCAACHTAPGGRDMAGGLAVVSPIGVIYSTNITPDRATGVGGETYGDFERAVRRGLSRSGETLYPAMPYPSFSRVSDADVQALYAYFMHGVAPVAQADKAEQIAWPLSLRWPLTYWRWIFAPAVRPFAPAPGQDTQVARGAYLVEGLGHCGACHTPRAITLQEKTLTAGDPRYLAGSHFNGWFAPTLRGDDLSGLGRWSGADIASFLGSGRTDKYTAFGEMGVVVQHSTQFVAPGDLAAIAAFLRTLAATPGASSAKAERTPYAIKLANASAHTGAQLFADNCAACHQDNGAGLPAGYPSLAGNPIVNADDPSSPIHIVLAGGAVVQTPSSQSGLVMPPFADSLSDQNVADLLTYVRANLGNRASAVTVAQVKAVRASLPATTQ
jgi:mono/diheme cytochrome c family protein